MKIFHLTLCLCTVLFVHPAWSDWAAVDENDLVEYSDLIVKATWLGQTVIRFQGMSSPKQVGVLQVEQTYKGKERDIALISLPLRPANVIASSDIHYTIGQNGIWILKQDSHSEGLYLADHPQRFWQPDHLNKLLRYLKPKP